MKTAAYIIMLALCAGIVVMNYKLNGQPRKEQVYNYKKGLASAIILAVLGRNLLFDFRLKGSNLADGVALLVL